MSEPYLSTIILSATLLDQSTYAEKNELIQKICTGDMHISFAYAEANKSYDYLNTNTTLDSKNILNGIKTQEKKYSTSNLELLSKHSFEFDNEGMPNKLINCANKEGTFLSFQNDLCTKKFRYL